MIKDRGKLLAGDRIVWTKRFRAVAGDDVYGKPLNDFTGQCLHAKKIGFIHPVTGEYLEFDSNLPEYFSNFLEKLKKIGY